jgi:hypothetical protein
MFYLGDDYVLARGNPVEAYSLYANAKLVPDNIRRFPHLERWVSNGEHLHTEKALLSLHEYAAHKLGRTFPLRALLLVKVSGGSASTLQPASPSDAFRVLAPTTLSHLPGSGFKTAQKIAQIVRSLPAYWLNAGTDLPQIPVRIQELLAGSAGGELLAGAP